jgi:hypothetical protein
VQKPGLPTYFSRYTGLVLAVFSRSVSRRGHFLKI